MHLSCILRDWLSFLLWFCLGLLFCSAEGGEVVGFSILVLAMIDSYPKATRASSIWQSLLWHQVCSENIAHSITTQALTF